MDKSKSYTLDHSFVSHSFHPSQDEQIKKE